MKESVGILYSIQQFLDLVEKHSIDVDEFYKSYNRYLLTTSSSVIEKGLEYDWIKRLDNNVLSLTKNGTSIIHCYTPQEKLRIQIMDIVIINKPRWFRLIPNGRKEVSKYFSANTYQCFDEADLFNSYAPEIVDWWDQLAAFSRDSQETDKLLIGRIGERLTIEYEENRINSKVKWQSIESNLSGFDILSSVNKHDITPLKIEVKTSKNNNHFYVTRKEWETAKVSKHYLFYFWVLEPHHKLFILDNKLINKHIPDDQGKGNWELVQITLSSTELESYLVPT